VYLVQQDHKQITYTVLFHFLLAIRHF